LEFRKDVRSGSGNAGVPQRWRLADYQSDWRFLCLRCKHGCDELQRLGSHLLDPYLMFAKEYGWANYMYQTNQGASYPALITLFRRRRMPRFS
jgi:hypothetical protein